MSDFFSSWWATLIPPRENGAGLSPTTPPAAGENIGMRFAESG